jgi:hypothetical protein
LSKAQSRKLVKSETLELQDTKHINETKVKKTGKSQNVFVYVELSRISFGFEAHWFFKFAVTYLWQMPCSDVVKDVPPL